jgi:hypothetical protein
MVARATAGGGHDRCQPVAATDHLLTLLDLSRWQFATTVMFHMTFPAITVGLAIFLCVLYGMHWRGWRRP